MHPLTYAIDFGTSNSLLAATDGHKVLPPVPLDPHAKDPTILKSVLYTPQAGQWFFGADAITQYGEHAAEGRIFRSIKKYLPDSAFSGTHVHNRFFNLPDLVAVFLREIRQRANTFYNADVTSVVLGRPAVFADGSDDDQLAEKRLLAAAQLAGFNEVSFCPEPVAAAYEFRHALSEPKMVLIADFGGGTSDYTILRLGPQRFTDKDILAIGGVPIAGDRFDGSIMKNFIAPHFGTNIVYKLPMGHNNLKLPQHLINRLTTPADISFLTRRDIMQLLKDAQRWAISTEDSLCMERLFILIEEHLGYKLFKAIEDTKIDLSSQESANFSFTHPGIEVKENVPQADFRLHTEEIVERIMKSLDDTLRRASVQPQEIDIVCCTGGTAQIPAISSELERRFGKEKLKQHRNFHSVIGGLAERALALHL